MGRITTVIFDVFETIAHNNPQLWIDAFKRICRVQGLNVDAGSLWQEWKAFEMIFRKERLNLKEPENSPPFKTYYEAWRDCFNDVFTKLGLKGDPAAAARYALQDMGRRELYQDALEALPVIQQRWRTAVLSNADNNYLFPVLDRLGLKFEAVLSSETARAYKPLPSPFRQILNMLDIGPEEAVYVGDNQFDDVFGAKGVGMRAAWVNRNGAALDPKLPSPDYQVSSLKEIPQLLGGKR